MFNNQSLSVITPFKGKAFNELKDSVISLVNQTYLRIDHIMIIERASYENTKNLFQTLEIDNKNYFFRLFISNNKGIYTSINQALDILEDSQPYLVLGAGDILKINAKVKFETSNKIYYLPYCLSSDVETLIDKFRNIFMGMPYCHNALIFRKNKLRYNQLYSLSADYDYFLRYIKNLQFGNKISKKYQFIKEIKSGYVIYESENGISTKKKGLVHLQNLLIIFKKFSILGLFIYSWLFFYKLFLRAIRSLKLIF